MSTHPLTKVMRDFAKAKCRRPEGSYTVDECAARWSKQGPCSVDKAKSMISEMVKSGAMTEIRGSRQTSQGQIVPCMYYIPALVKK
jgi:hypothetical protein